MECRKCKAPLIEHFNFCSRCGAQQQGSFKRKMVALLAVIGVVLMALLAIGLLLPNEEANEPVQQLAVGHPMVFEDTAVIPPAQVFADNAAAVFHIIATDDESWNTWVTGSGFFISADGIAVTNHHVIESATEAYIITDDGREFEIIGFYNYDIQNDLAVIQIDGTGFTYVAMGDSHALRIGDTVHAIGSPAGERNTFSSGNVSRFVDMVQFGPYRVHDTIQVTAPIYEGSSGGALFNDRGQVVGVTSAGNTERASVNFVVPIYRVNLDIQGQANALPVPSVAEIRRAAGGENDNLDSYVLVSGVPAFGRIAHTALFWGGGHAQDFVNEGFDNYGFYDFMYIYDLLHASFEDYLEAYVALLEAYGFLWQHVVEGHNQIWFYFYHEEDSLSVTLEVTDDEFFIVLIGSGDAFTFFWSDFPDIMEAASLGLGGEELVVEQSSVHEIVGTWAWNLNQTWTYTFNADGTGIRGFPNQSDSFTWEIVNNDLLLTPSSGIIGTESWAYEIAGDVFTIRSNQVAGLVFSYIWVD